MGAVEVRVGCRHRLRGPIGPHTRYPCPACTPSGFPGLWAIALTVDYGPRLSKAAVTGRATPDPTQRVEVRPPATTIAQSVMQGTGASIERAGTYDVSVGPFVASGGRLRPRSDAMLRIERLPSTEEDRQRNQVRFEVVAEERVSMDDVRRLAARSLRITGI